MANMSFTSTTGLLDGQMMAVQAAIEVLMILGKRWLFRSAIDEPVTVTGRTRRSIQFYSDQDESAGEITLCLYRGSHTGWQVTSACYANHKESDRPRAFFFGWDQGQICTIKEVILKPELDIVDWHRSYEQICFYTADNSPWPDTVIGCTEKLGDQLGLF